MEGWEIQFLAQADVIAMIQWLEIPSLQQGCDLTEKLTFYFIKHWDLAVTGCSRQTTFTNTRKSQCLIPKEDNMAWCRGMEFETELWQLQFWGEGTYWESCTPCLISSEINNDLLFKWDKLSKNTWKVLCISWNQFSIIPTFSWRVRKNDNSVEKSNWETPYLTPTNI